MNSGRFAQVTTALCGTVGFAGWVVASLAGLGSADIENAGAVPIEDRRPPSLTGKVVDAPQATALGDIAVASADAATVAELVTRTAALPNRSQVLPPEILPVQVATADTPDPVLKYAREPSADREDPRQEGQRKPATSPALMDGSMEAGPRDRIGRGTVV